MAAKTVHAPPLRAPPLRAECQLHVTAACSIHYPKYDDNVSFQGLLKFAPT